MNNLEGTIWGIKDVIARVGGMRRETFMQTVLVPKKDELTKSGAILHWSETSNDTYKFRATKMASWMEDNLQTIANGGWK